MTVRINITNPPHTPPEAFKMIPGGLDVGPLERNPHIFLFGLKWSTSVAGGREVRVQPQEAQLRTRYDCRRLYREGLRVMPLPNGCFNSGRRALSGIRLQYKPPLRPSLGRTARK